ncbi:MAG: hypothetical protein ACE5GQ_10945 [Nitrospinales bacterium]
MWVGRDGIFSLSARIGFHFLLILAYNLGLMHRNFETRRAPARVFSGRIAILLLLLLFFPAECLAFDYNFEGRFRVASRFIPESPKGFDNQDSFVELRLGVDGNVLRREEWSLDYEILTDGLYFRGPGVEAGFQEELKADFFRAWARLEKGKWRFRGGRQQILFGAGALFRPLGFFDARVISGVLPQTRGVDGARFTYFIDETTTVQGWTIPAKFGDRLIAGWRWEGLIAGLETGLVFQYHPRTDLETLPNFNLEAFQLGYHLKGEYEVGYWSEGRLDIEKNIGGRSLRFEGVFGVDYTFDLGEGLHVLAEYLLSTRQKSFIPSVLGGGQTIHQFGFLLDQPVGIATVWKLFGFYDVLDGSFQLVPLVEYAITDQTFIYFQGNWGGNVKGNEDVGRLFQKGPVFTGSESSLGLSLVFYL